MMAICRARFGERPVLVPIAVPHFYYEDLLLEVDVFAGSPGGPVIERAADGARVRILDGGELAWASVQVAADRLPDGATLLGAALAELGLSEDDRILEHWFAPTADAQGGDPAAVAERLSELRLISDEGALVTGSELPLRLVGELTYASGDPGVADRSSEDACGTRVRSRQKGRFTWLSARCLNGDLGLVEQTSQIMSAIERSLWETGLSFGNVVKSTSHYVGGRSPEELHDNMAVRNRYYATPGPASTGLPVFALADANSRIAVDILAARDPQDGTTATPR